MLGRLVEKMMRGNKASSDDEGYLSRYLDVICPQYAAQYNEVMHDKPADAEIDALDVLANMLMSEMGISNGYGAAARAYLSILIENEHLPVRAHLSANELNALRELLFCYFNGAGDVNEKGSQVLGLIEQKFSHGDFSQARILLQIFETNNETRLNNERNLYYEEMIMRLDSMGSRAKSLPESLTSFDPVHHSDDATVLQVLNDCEACAGASFYLFLRDPDELTAWQQALSSLDEQVQQYLLDYIPVVRWRKVGSITSEDLRSQLGRHMTFEMLRRHVQQKIRMCYFILLASGSTGHEWFIFAFTEWSRKHFNVDVRDLFPFIHRSGIVDNICLQEILDMATDRFFGPAMNSLSIHPETLEKAYISALEFIAATDFSQVPPGNYNLGDFLLDVILDFDYQDPLLAYRTHAIM